MGNQGNKNASILALLTGNRVAVNRLLYHHAGHRNRKHDAALSGSHSDKLRDPDRDANSGLLEESHPGTASVSGANKTNTGKGINIWLGRK